MLNKQTMISKHEALAGRDTPILSTAVHFINHTDLTAPPPKGCQEILLGLGCFWGAERLFWNLPGVVSTSVGYAGGFTPNPTYKEVCSGRTGHAEVVRVIFDPSQLSLEALLQLFWEKHDPTQEMAQGNDKGTQYRSAIYTYSDEQLTTAQATRSVYQKQLEKIGTITTEIIPAKTYYLAEKYHQQYLAKNSNGYCGIHG